MGQLRGEQRQAASDSRLDKIWAGCDAASALAVSPEANCACLVCCGRLLLLQATLYISTDYRPHEPCACALLIGLLALAFTGLDGLRFLAASPSGFGFADAAGRALFA